MADWADEYAKERGVTRQALIETALCRFRELSRGGVPDLTPDGEVVEPQRPRAVSGVVRASSLVPASPLVLERQRKLNEAAARSRAGAPKKAR